MKISRFVLNKAFSNIKLYIIIIKFNISKIWIPFEFSQSWKLLDSLKVLFEFDRFLKI